MNRRRWIPAALGIGAVAILASASEPGGPEEQAALKAAVPQKWEYVLPGDAAEVKLQSHPSGGYVIPIPHSGGEGFVAQIDGAALAVDTNGDGKVDEKVKGVGGMVTLRGKTKDGKALSYAVRVAQGAGGWTLAPASVMVGKVAGVEVKLVDANCNGDFSEYGVDAMIVGNAKSASKLSKVVNLGGKLMDFTVTADGGTMTVKPRDGETGVINLAKGWKSEGAELIAAVVANATGDVSFEVAAAKAGLSVPAGEYKVVSGFAAKGGESVKIRGAGMKPIKVEAGQTATLAWGGPVEMDFEFSVTKDVLTVPPTLKYLGQAGEEYFEFKPDAKSPKIVVFDPKSKSTILEGRFGGC